MSEREVHVIFTLGEARALLCWRSDCDCHPPEDKSAAWSKLAKATRRVTAPVDPEEDPDG
jgi:hypothetical protein